MPFRLDTLFYQIPGPQTETTFGAIIEMLLKTRLKLHLETSRESNDEDVNAYLAGLLVSYIDSKYLQVISEALSHYDIDVFHAVEKAEDRVHAYWIYKVNADDLLVSMGIFGQLKEQAKGEIVRLKRYYAYASEFQRRIYGKPTAVGEVHTKLADRTERYLKILEGTRSDYLHLMELTRPEEFAAWLHQLERELPLKALQDEFLDAYSAWSKDRQNLEVRQRLRQFLERLQSLDPHFQPPPKDFLSLP